MSDSDLLDEYVLNENGVLFQGTHKQIGPKPWYFGQVFTNDIGIRRFSAIYIFLGCRKTLIH